MRPFVLSLALLTPTIALAGEVSYSKHVRPFLAKYCLECHNGKRPKGGLDLESVQGMLEGGNKGDVLVAGKPDASRLVTMTEGTTKPVMPPASAKRRPKKDEVAVLRAWVRSGAKDDGGTFKVAIPDIKPRLPSPPPVRTLAFSPDGKRVAFARDGYLVRRHLQAKGLEHLEKRLEPIQAVAFGMGSDKRLGEPFLVVGAGQPGKKGTLHLLGSGLPLTTWPGHDDAILDLAISPDGKTVATAGYDTRIRIAPLPIGRLVKTDEIRVLKDHSDAVYGLAFRPDGKQLASCSADRAVKVWETATGRLVYTLSEANDWLYTVAWSPDGKYLAAGGVDKSIRVYRPEGDKATLLHAVFAHEGAVQKVRFSRDGHTLYSLGQDRVLKAWDAATMKEKKIFEAQPETVLCFDVDLKGKTLALGRYDGVVVILDADSGKTMAVWPPKLEATSRREQSTDTVPVALAQVDKKPPVPVATRLEPNAVRIGEETLVHVHGKLLASVTAATVSGTKAQAVLEKKTAASLLVRLRVPKDQPPGRFSLVLQGKGGESKPIELFVDRFPLRPEGAGNESPGTGTLTTLPGTIAGSLEKTGDADWFRFQAGKGEAVSFQVLTGAVGSQVEAYLELVDAKGNRLAESDRGYFSHTFAAKGTYALGIRDRELRGGPGMNYRLFLGPIPIVDGIFPLGAQRGSEASVEIRGAFLKQHRVRMVVPKDAAIGAKLPVPLASDLGLVLGAPTLTVGEYPETTRTQEAVSEPASLEIPGTGNGVGPGLWRIHARKGETLVLETQADRLGSSLDSVLEILDPKGQPLPRALLRCRAMTFVTFRDHDSRQPNIRIEAWNDLGVNDHIWVGSELLKIRALPTHPDADCNFFSAGGQRKGFLDTTTHQLANNTPMYKVSIHPPGTKLPPNGFPVFPVFYRNDDGGPGLGRDSRLFFDPPADGDYLVRVSDARGRSGRADLAYRLTVRRPRPDFTLSFSPNQPTVTRGQSRPLAVTARRIDGFDGPIRLRLVNLFEGFSCPETTIEEEQDSAVLGLFAGAEAAIGKKAPPLKLVGEARIGGKAVVREASGGLPKITDDAGDILTTTEESEIHLKPGGITTLTVNIERRKGFLGRVPLDVRNLPHGVRVLDIGLNGILITEREVRRTMRIYAEPWVEAADRPIVVLARREGKNTEHAAHPVLLKIGR